MQTQFFEVGHENYCEMRIRLFADVSFIPDFMLDYFADRAGAELASSYRQLIADAVAENKGAAK